MHSFSPELWEHSTWGGLPSNSIHKLQLIQNCASWILTQTKKSTHITSIIAVLHWLPVPQIIDYKMILLVYKALNGVSPAYLSDLLSPYEPPRTLRSSHAKLLHAPRTRLRITGGRAFSSHAHGTHFLINSGLFRLLLKLTLRQISIGWPTLYGLPPRLPRRH